MKINSRTRLQLKLQSSFFVVLFILFIGILAWLSTQYKFTFDLTANKSNSLSTASTRLLENITQAVKITAFISPVNEQKEILDKLFKRYQQNQPLIDYQSINPDLAPEQLREFNIQRDGEVVIEVNGRRENIIQVDESSITNAIARLQREGDNWVVFLQGHGERDPFSGANFGLQIFADRLSQKGFQIENLNLINTPDIPDNTDVLVIADVQSNLLEGELKLIKQFVESGGSLFWLTEPGENSYLESLQEILQIEFLPGIIVDPSTQLLGLDRADFALAADYPRHAITTAIDSITLYPKSQAIELPAEDSEWQATPLVVTHDRTWNETGEMTGQITMGDNPGEQAGPLNIGISLTRSLQKEDGELFTQRIVVTGDADFLSNQYLGNGSNQALGLNMVNWLSHDDNLIAVSPSRAIDTKLELSPTHQVFIAVFFFLVLPLALLASGISIWLIRRKR